MKLHLTPAEALKFGSLFLCFLGVASGVVFVLTGDGPLQRSWARYKNYLDGTLRTLFREGSANQIVSWQIGLICAVLVVELAVMDIPFWFLIIPLIAVMPALYLASERADRVKKLEEQVDSFILALANSLKTVPSPGAALQAVLPVLQNPTRQEIERVVKEMRVGNTVEQALVNMSARVRSRTVDAALSAVLIGLQVGGNLPVVLETTAATIREMKRLEGVVRTKTSEGRAQLLVLILFPFGIIGAFNWVQAGYFDPLQKTFIGYVIVTGAVFLWLAALLLARKILTVDI